MLLTQRPTSLPDLEYQPFPVYSPGIELLTTYQIGNQGGLNTSWTASILEFDAPASFGKYSQFLFQISALGVSTTASLNMDIRKNYRTNPGINRALQAWSPTAAASINYLNNAPTTGALALSAAAFTTDQYIRDIEILFTQTGVNHVLRTGSNTTLNTAGIWQGTQSFTLGTTSNEPYGFNDIPGISLTPSAGTFALPAYASSSTNASIDMECRIYGWRRA